ncbi:DNA translocase FtsK [Desulfitobacterium sp. AusDCA]|uniref:DNA translocase FtsK n=1 Tax=Desulfitobacterium sp. AusDCA TaxID=3240383 RepID=UPI003DA73B0B
MKSLNPHEIIELLILMLLIGDFLRVSAKKGSINILDFPAYLFLLLGRLLDTFVGAATSFLKRDQTLFDKTLKNWGRYEFVHPIENSHSPINQDMERFWLQWARRNIPVLLQTLERSGAKIMVEHYKLPGNHNFSPTQTQKNPNWVRTLDFEVAFLSSATEIWFIPKYFFGVDPTLRTAIRSRVEDGTIAVALNISKDQVHFGEKNGQEIIAVRVGEEESRISTTPLSTGQVSVPPILNPNLLSSSVIENAPYEIQKISLDIKPIREGLPPLSLFQSPKKKPIQTDDAAQLIMEAFNRLGIGVEKDGPSKFQYLQSIVGPAVSQIIFHMPPRVKMSSLSKEGENIAAELGISGSIRIAAVPGMAGCVGIEIPNKRRGIVTIQEMVASPEFRESSAALPVCVGVTIHNKPLIADLAKLPHLLVAGATNQGKSVGLNAMIVSLILRFSPGELKLMMVDPKAVELTMYEDLPHLMAPIATTAPEANKLLNSMVREMDKRYQLMRKHKARNISEYNPKVNQDQRFFYIVGIVDEYADLMMGAKSGGEGKELETAVARLGQKARAAGIHLILATQRPTADIVTGLIKANMPGRLAYKVSSTTDSMVILDRPGAETLTGMGDLLLLGPSDPEPIRAQGPLVTDEEIEKVVAFWSQNQSSHQIPSSEKDNILPGEPTSLGYHTGSVSSLSTVSMTTHNKQEALNHPNEQLLHQNFHSLNADKSTLQLKPIERKVVPLPLTPKSGSDFDSDIETRPNPYFENSNVQEQHSLPQSNKVISLGDIPTIKTDIFIEGRSGKKVNLGLPPKPGQLRMDDKLWALLYGYSVRLIVRDKSPRREYVKMMLNIKTDVAQILIQFMEARGIISPYKGPNSPRQIFVTLDQVEEVYSESFFAMNNYANMT